jgi:molybdate transport system substrate-binding protein
MMRCLNVATLSIALAIVLAVASPVIAAADVTVFAAASLREALGEHAKQFEASTGNNVIVSYGASNALAKQIETGAPADIFISADLEWMDYVDQKHQLAPNSVQSVAQHTVLIAPSSSSSKLRSANFGLAAALGRKTRLPIPTACRQGYGKGALEKLGVWTRSEAGCARRACARTVAFFPGRSALASSISPTPCPTRA